MKEKLERYKELKQQLKEYHEKSIGNRIKKGGLLEQRIKEKFNKVTADKVLIRSNDFNNDKLDTWNKQREEFFKLKYELEDAGFIEL